MRALLNSHLISPARTGRISAFLTGLPLAATLASLPAGAFAATLPFLADFTSTNEFTYVDDAFGTSSPDYASGSWQSGALRVNLGGVNGNDIQGMSGGWRYTLTLDSDAEGVVLSFRYNLTQTGYYESNEYSRVLVSVNGVRYGRGPKDFVDHIGGDGESSDFSDYSGVLADRSTGWLTFEVFLGDLDAETYELVIGGFNNLKTNSNESTEVLIDDVLITSGNPQPEPTAAQVIIDRLGPSEVDPSTWQPLQDPGNAYTQFKSDIYTLSNFCGLLGSTYICDRYNMHDGLESDSFVGAKEWVVDELGTMGYTNVERHDFTYRGYYRENVYATKVGTVNPNKMYIVSCHLDGRGHTSSQPGGAADDDASGCALVLAAARAFAAPDVTTDKSIRFIFWNNEETGYDGSTAYRDDRAPLRGTSEPDWLGIIQHDMILYDHGKPNQANQIAGADIDVEYRRGTTFATESQALTEALKAAAGRYTVKYPAEIGDYSEFTDDKPFWNDAPAISVRENRRCCEITNVHPYYHKPSDVYESYSEDDYRLGFDTVRMTIGAVAELAGATASLNEKPTADDKAVTLDEDTFAAIMLTGSDPEEQSLTFAIASGPANGTLTGVAPDLVYTPNPDYFGPDSFSFTVDDGELTSDPATVSITVNPINDDPQTQFQSLETEVNTPLPITLVSSDPDGDILEYVIFEEPTSGTLTGTAPDLVYTPDADFLGSDRFQYYVTDGEGFAEAIITITVTPANLPPIAFDLSISTAEDSPVTFDLIGTDPDGPDFDNLTYEVLTQPANGVLSVLSANGKRLSYTPNADFNGADSFTYRVDDGEAVSGPATVTIAVASVNDAPTADAQSVTTDEGTAVDITLTGSDPEDDPLNFQVDGPANGTLSGTAPNLTYTPGAGFTGEDSFTFTVSDGQATSAPATVTITVNPPGPVVVFVDDFETDQGWLTDPNDADTATTGQWEWANPQGTSSSGPKQLGTTVSGDYDLVTGPLAGSSAGSYDIDGGVTSIRSPAILLPTGRDLTLSFFYYLAHANNSSSADYLRVTVVGETTSMVVLEERGAGNDDDAVWEKASVSLNDFAGQTVNLLIAAADASGASLVEAAIDDVSIVATIPPILRTGFDSDADGFNYADDAFRSTSNPGYADGEWVSGVLRVTLGGLDNTTVNGMSGGWGTTFTLSQPKEVRIAFRYNLTQSSEYESDEYSEVLVSVDDVFYGQGSDDYVARIAGNGNGGSSRSTGWQNFEADLDLSAGDHTLMIGGYNNRKTYHDEFTQVLIDDVVVSLR